MLGRASIGFHAKQLCVHMCAHVCGCLHVCLFGVCRCRRPPWEWWMLKPSTTTIPLRLVSSQKNYRTADNDDRRNMPPYHKSRLLLLLLGSPSLVTAFVTSHPPPFFFAPGLPFYFPFNHLLNGMDFLIVCFAEQIYLCSFFPFYRQLLIS